LDCIVFDPDVQQILNRSTKSKENHEVVLNWTPDVEQRVLQGIQSASEQFPQAHILCPHFTRGILRKKAIRVLKKPPVFLSAKEIESYVDINRVAMITMKGIKLVS